MEDKVLSILLVILSGPGAFLILILPIALTRSVSEMGIGGGVGEDKMADQLLSAVLSSFDGGRLLLLSQILAICFDINMALSKGVEIWEFGVGMGLGSEGGLDMLFMRCQTSFGFLETDFSFSFQRELVCRLISFLIRLEVELSLVLSAR